MKPSLLKTRHILNGMTGSSIKSVVFFEQEDFVCVFAEVSGNLQGNDSRRHVAAGLDEVDGLS